MKKKYLYITVAIITAIVTLTLLTFSSPKYCGSWSSWDWTSKGCECIGIKNTPGMLDATVTYCYGICHSCKCYKNINTPTPTEIPCN